MARADRRNWLQLIAGGLRWRAGASIAMLLVAIAAIAAGTFGPLYLSEADRSVLLSTLRAAPAGNTGLMFLPSGGPDAHHRLLRATGAVARAFGPRRLFGPTIVTEYLAVTTTSTTTGQGYGSELVARTGVCRHLFFTAGTCPTSGGTVAVSTRSAQALGLHTGDRLTVAAAKSPRPIVLDISGLFRSGDAQAPFWWGEDYFPFGLSFSTSHPILDDLFASEDTLRAVTPPGQESFVAQRPLEADAISPGDVSAFETSLSAFRIRARAVDGVEVTSDVTSSLGTAAQDEHTTGTIVVVVDLQLVLLSLLVLYFVAARTAEGREPDVRLAELRGFARPEAAAVALLEPLTILAAAVPIGILAAWLTAVVATPHLFVQGVTPVIAPLAIGAALLSFAAGMAATVLGARRLVVPRPGRDRATAPQPWPSPSTLWPWRWPPSPSSRWRRAECRAGPIPIPWPPSPPVSSPSAWGWPPPAFFRWRHGWPLPPPATPAGRPPAWPFDAWPGARRSPATSS